MEDKFAEWQRNKWKVEKREYRAKKKAEKLKMSSVQKEGSAKQ